MNTQDATVRTLVAIFTKGARLFFIAAITLGIANAVPTMDLVPSVSLPGNDVERPVALQIDPVDPRQRAQDVQRMLSDLNELRRGAGLPPLVLDRRLVRVAVGHAADMIAHRFFGHDSSNGLTPFERFDRAGVRYGAAGENIALDDDEPSAARELERSNEHRENMLDPHYRHVGIAALRAQDGSEIFVQDFTD